MHGLAQSAYGVAIATSDGPIIRRAPHQTNTGFYLLEVVVFAKTISWEGTRTTRGKHESHPVQANLSTQRFGSTLMSLWVWLIRGIFAELCLV
jgi:hypothetical protein